MSMFFMLPRFGRFPGGERLERIKLSPNYAGGKFKNQTPTEMMTGDKGRLAALLEFLFVERPGLRPPRPLPVVATDLRTFERDVLVWLGHSTSFLQLGGVRVLIDPVLSSYAAPFYPFNRAFDGDSPFAASDIPEIDCLIISHDHWDHLDYATLMAIRDRVKSVVCPIGVGAHLERWGFKREIIFEADWNEEVRTEGLTVHVLPARHFSGRLIRRNRTLWAGFMLEGGGKRVFYSGDSGYGPHFVQIGERFGKIDLAIMENGQYDPGWKYIHMMPEEAVQGALDLQAAALLPVHSGRFSISNHTWDDPYVRIHAASQSRDIRLLTPVMGEVVRLDDLTQSFGKWWE